MCSGSIPLAPRYKLRKIPAKDAAINIIVKRPSLKLTNLKDSLKEKTFFKDLRKEVNTGANGTQDYVVKKGANKDTVASTRQ